MLKKECVKMQKHSVRPGYGCTWITGVVMNTVNNGELGGDNHMKLSKRQPLSNGWKVH